MALGAAEKKRLRGIGHALKPVVTIAGSGLTDAVTAEIERALDDHELIKIAVRVDDRDQRRTLAESVCARTGAELVQAIGKVVLICRRAATPDPRLSNLLRHQARH